MARYALFITPAYGHVNPTLAVAQELVVRGEQVVYYLTEEFRTIIESTGSRLHPLSDELFQGMNPSTAPGGPGSSSLCIMEKHASYKKREIAIQKEQEHNDQTYKGTIYGGN